MSADTPALTYLPQHTGNGRARMRALLRHANRQTEAVASVEYRSRGNLLVIGEAAVAARCVSRLGEGLHCVVLACDAGADEVNDSDARTWVRGRLDQLRGHLGRFSASVQVDGQPFNPAHLGRGAPEYFDLVLDLDTRPAIVRDMAPPGYFAPTSEAELEEALAALPGLVGEFEKPRYFQYDASICAHGRSGLEGCRRCIDACPAQAISSLKEMIEVDPYLCQGAGSCASACPSGAIHYAYPRVSHVIDALRGLLRDYRGEGGAEPQVLFADGGAGAQALAALAGRLPEAVLPVQVEEIGSVGMEVWLSALAYGARRVMLLATPSVPCSVLREVSLQLSYAGGILESLGYPRSLLQLVVVEGDGSAAEQVLSRPVPAVEIEPAGFAGLGQKRAALRIVLDHLYACAPAPQPVAELPDGAPFGAIEVNPQSCTLCMACVSVCPAQALYDGGDRPQLRFIEGNCVQCGLCHAACPEDAIRLLPRIVYEMPLYREQRVLHQEDPFCCVNCGTPFATRAVIQRLTEKLAGHWMYQEAAAMQRLRMCERCRAIDMFAEDRQPGAQDRSGSGLS